MYNTNWSVDQRVTYVTRDGDRYTKTIQQVTTEGFAVIDDNGTELIFSQSGQSINDAGGDHGSPKIIPHTSQKHFGNKKVPNYKNTTFEQPWDNVFAMKNLSLSEWKALIDILIEQGLGDEKLHLKNFGESATIDHKKQVRKVFLAAKDRIKAERKHD